MDIIILEKRRFNTLKPLLNFRGKMYIPDVGNVLVSVSEGRFCSLNSKIIPLIPNYNSLYCDENFVWYDYLTRTKISEICHFSPLKVVKFYLKKAA